MKAINRISAEAVENFCAITGCKAVYRGGGRPKAKHWQITLDGRRLFFVKATSSMRRFMELYERTMRRFVDDSDHTIGSLVYANLANKAAIHERLANGRTFPTTDRCKLHGAVGGHGVSPVRAFVMAASRPADQQTLRGQDGHPGDGADVAADDPVRPHEEAENFRVDTLPQDVQNALALHSLVVRGCP